MVLTYRTPAERSRIAQATPTCDWALVLRLHVGMLQVGGPQAQQAVGRTSGAATAVHRQRCDRLIVQLGHALHCSGLQINRVKRA